MSEELAVVVPEQAEAVVDTNAQPATSQEPTVEDLAREKGWRPKEEYSGDAGRWKSAEVFLALDEPIQKIEALAKELKEQKKANQMLLQHHQQVKESEFKRAYEFLKSQKKQEKMLLQGGEIMTKGKKQKIQFFILLKFLMKRKDL